MDQMVGSDQGRAGVKRHQVHAGGMGVLVLFGCMYHESEGYGWSARQRGQLIQYSAVGQDGRSQVLLGTGYCHQEGVVGLVKESVSPPALLVVAEESVQGF